MSPGAPPGDRTAPKQSRITHRTVRHSHAPVPQRGRCRHEPPRAREDYRRFVAEARGSEYSPWESLIGKIYLGGEAFCDMVQKIVDSQPGSRAYPRAQVEIVRPTLEHVIALVLCEFDETVEDLRKENRRQGRKAFAALAHREAGLTYRMIAESLGVSPPAISKMIEATYPAARKSCAHPPSA